MRAGVGGERRPDQLARKVLHIQRFLTPQQPLSPFPGSGTGLQASPSKHAGYSVRMENAVPIVTQAPGAQPLQIQPGLLAQVILSLLLLVLPLSVLMLFTKEIDLH